MTVTIAELVAISTSMQNRFAQLFETLGRWVATTDDPETQQRFARNAHRHAWHAELWAARRPTVPIEAVRPSLADVEIDAQLGDGAARSAWYDEQIELLRSELTDLHRRVDPQLDPGTARVISLISADLA